MIKEHHHYLLSDSDGVSCPLLHHNTGCVHLALNVFSACETALTFLHQTWAFLHEVFALPSRTPLEVETENEHEHQCSADDYASRKNQGDNLKMAVHVVVVYFRGRGRL